MEDRESNSEIAAPPPPPLHVTYQPTLHGVSSSHVRLSSDCTRTEDAAAAANNKASHVRFRCVVCPEKKGFHDSRDFILQSIKTTADSQGNSILILHFIPATLSIFDVASSKFTS